MKQRSKRSLLSRLRVFWIFIVVALGCAAYAGYRIATWPGFFPSSVGVVGAVHVTTSDVLKRAALGTSENVWLIDKRAAEGRVDAVPWVRATQIHRALPAKVMVVVFERVPAACVESAGARYLVDDTARVIATTCDADHSAVEIGWPSLAAQRAGTTLDVNLLQRFLGDVQTLRAAHLDPAYVNFDRFGGLEARLHSGLPVRFGDDRDLTQKAELVEPILRAYGSRTRNVAALDLRAPNTPVVEERKPYK